MMLKSVVGTYKIFIKFSEAWFAMVVDDQDAFYHG